MKRAALLLSIIALSIFNCYSQHLRPPKKKIFSVDVGIEHNYMPLKWFGNENYDNLIKNKSIGEIYARANLKVYKNLAIWLSVGLFAEGGKKLPEQSDLLNNLNLNLADYYITEAFTDTPHRSNPNFDIGVSYDFYVRKWVLTPLVGIGMRNSPYGEISYKLKEKGSNQAYSVNYEWGKYMGTMASINLQLKASRKITEKLSIFAGLKFDQYINRLNMTTSIKDYYDYTLISEKKTKSRFVNTLGISAGLSF